jgi:hypothetical protein
VTGLCEQNANSKVSIDTSELVIINLLRLLILPPGQML